MRMNGKANTDSISPTDLDNRRTASELLGQVYAGYEAIAAAATEEQRHAARAQIGRAHV